MKHLGSTFNTMALGLGMSLALPVAAQSITDLDTTSGVTSSLYGLNAAGDVLVGSYTISPGVEHAAVWRGASYSMIDLGTLGGTTSQASAVNADGSVIVGTSFMPGDTVTHAVIWSGATYGMIDLGSLSTGSSSAAAVNAAGNVVVGFSENSSGYSRAFRWVEGVAMADLGTLGGNTSIADGVNAAGNVVVGAADLASGDSHAFRWVEGVGMADLGTFGGTASQAYAVNAAGDVVVGSAQNSSGADRAFRWTSASGIMTDLGTLGGSNAIATAVNADGTVVVGASELSGGAISAFRWNTTSGMQSIEDWLAANGVSVTGISTALATGVNAEGNVVVGMLNNNHAFIARVASSGSGLIDVPEFNAGLAKVASSGQLAANDADTVMNGMHSNPMRALLAEGRSSFWVAGDAGRHDGGPYDSKLGIAEIGFGHRFNQRYQFNVSAGRTYNQTDTGLGGRTDARSTFVVPELVVSLPASFYATVTAYYGQGNADIDRAYLNAGTPQQAYGSPGQETMGARLRLDWLNALALGKTRLTPYASLTYLRTRTDAYTEQGGAFAVRWNGRTDRATTARVGVDAIYPLSPATVLQGRVEGAHRFETTGAATSGEVVGLYGFGFAGQDTRQDWVRLGAGIESRIGSGIASLMLNTTSQGEAPSYWAAASYRWEF